MRWVQLCTCHSVLSCWYSCCASIKHNPRAGTEDSLSCGKHGVPRASAGPLQQAGASGPFCYWGRRDYNPVIKVSSQRLAESRSAGLCQHPWRRKREMEGRGKKKDSTNTMGQALGTCITLDIHALSSFPRENGVFEVK